MPKRDRKCVLLGIQNQPKETWCGDKHPFGWLFQDVTHVALTGRNGSSIYICEKCAAAIQQAVARLL